MKKKFALYVDGIYIKNGKILLLKRAKNPLKGFWHHVGGEVEDKETLKDALKREFMEETNLEVEIGEIIAGRIEETFDKIKIIIAFKIIAARGKIKINKENEKFDWLNKYPKNSVFDYSHYL
jgi:ADP-ribose pyrophosphatase YjhB (NUDIX family)